MYPSGLEAAPDGTVVVADTGNNRVARYSADGSLVWSVGTHGTGTNQFDNPRDIGVDASNNVYVADTRNSRIVKLSPSGAWLASHHRSEHRRSRSSSASPSRATGCTSATPAGTGSW